jgi:hypothetical protein
VYSITLQAIDGSGVNQDVETIMMNVRYPDLEVDEFGPNNKVCENNGTRIDGAEGNGDQFDQSYLCMCATVGRTSYSGDNCEDFTIAPLPSTSEGGGNIPIVAGGMAGAVIFIFCVALILYKRRMHAIKMRAFDFAAEIERLINAGEIDADDEAASRTPREIKRSHVTSTEMIGEGAFGEVWKAVLDETAAGGVPGYMVAVKTSKETKGEGADEMLREATVMAQVSGHRNLVSLIGVVTSGAPLLLLLSLCENGSLLAMLKKRSLKTSGAKPFTQGERMQMVLDTARGMEHLTVNKFVHRDLAARNVLVDALLNCKIADFGLARGTAGAKAGPDTNEDGDEEEYYRSRTGTFPVRWTAPEAMQTMRFTEGSDVWSFGITCIEVFTDGGKPYATMSNAAVISQVQGGYRAPQPKLCPVSMYALMLECWHVKAAGRPTFERLVQQIAAMETKTELTTVDGTAENNRNTATTGGGASRSAVVKNETYASGGIVETEPATHEETNFMYGANAHIARPVALIAETAIDDEYMSITTHLGGNTHEAAAEGDYLGVAAVEEAEEEYLTVATGLGGSTLNNVYDTGPSPTAAALKDTAAANNGRTTDLSPMTTSEQDQVDNQSEGSDYDC